MTAPPLSTRRSLALHLGPGAVALAAYAAAVPVAGRLDLPPIAALAAAGLAGVVPVQLALVRRLGPVSLRARLPWPRVLAWGGLEVLLAAAAFALTAPLAGRLRAGLFGWWPAGWGLVPDYAGYPRPALLATAVLMLAGSVILAPVAEELYFRGCLLPRLPGRAAPLAHAALFAGYHLWTPWLAPTRTLAVLPLAWIALRTRDVRIGIVAHASLNAVDLLILIRHLAR